MQINGKFLAGFFTILFFLFFILAIALHFIVDITLIDLRFTTQFQQDLHQYTTEEYLVENFEKYGDTQILDLDGKNDFSIFQQKGMIIGWVDIEDYRLINSIDLELCDSTSCFQIKGPDNKPDLSRLANGLWTDDDFVDYSFSCNQSNSVWRDWMLVNGENLVFWEWDNYLPIGTKEVTIKTSYPMRDAFIVRGFCEDETPTNANWIAPNGLIQYGFHYIKDGSLFMKNVRQSQMVTNGDHTRIISNTKGTPRNFIMRVEFTPINVQDEPTHNDYIRIAWDFENEWDPGHDQTLVYITSEYEYFGMQRVYPIVRQKEQGYENSPKQHFKLKNNGKYEIYVKVYGQKAEAILYERKFGLIWEKASVKYSFTAPRPNESYPFSFEATGNPNLRIDAIDVREIME